ncbi:DUF5071 domain-containing protein [Clostridium fungisolvens]|uniref:DUF5071 domain-containing protein n=1 Tax=Clostridium fungisolvens TaxID=1604897 RepID=A0A6V8SJS0_9CLOT|nr:DUF5071 domain-containing protein [Clostridium fungisolvens]GFP77474.1 hypothetical protein bsdtw1_03602 [Clostridium fungisolvens]
MDKDLYIPKSKYDFETVERIRLTDPENIQDILPQIFQWIEDINWPIAPELVKILAGFDEMIIPYVIDLIQNPNGLREYSIYYFMLPLLSNKQLHLLKDELERVTNNPSFFESAEGYDKIAIKYIEKIY